MLKPSASSSSREKLLSEIWMLSCKTFIYKFTIILGAFCLSIYIFFFFICRILVYVESGAACYNLLQLCKCLIPAWSRGNSKMSFIYVAWVFLLLDQVSVLLFSLIFSNLKLDPGLNNTSINVFLCARFCAKS
jgi:hypothetical protein